MSINFPEVKNENESAFRMPWQYFPKLKKACKMGVSDAKEVKFTTGLPLLQEEKIKYSKIRTHVVVVM